MLSIIFTLFVRGLMIDACCYSDSLTKIYFLVLSLISVGEKQVPATVGVKMEFFEPAGDQVTL